MQTYRQPLAMKLANRVMGALIKLGLPVRGGGAPTVLLTVPGRKSGIPRTTPVTLLPAGKGWHLMAPYGVVDWVRNLRTAGSATISMRGRAFTVTARELSPADGAPILRDTLANANGVLRKVFAPYFDTPPDASVDAWTIEAERHPVFLLQRVGDRQQLTTRQNETRQDGTR